MDGMQIIGLAWVATGLLGGFIINRRDRLAGFDSWGMAAALGPITLLLGVAETLAIRSQRKSRKGGEGER